ncbi:MAG: VWA domain-containing protein [Gammaproteobacteria bacterium]|nr:VWA domain-containing protein [Gammaproteobacteria bacterium]
MTGLFAQIAFSSPAYLYAIPVCCIVLAAVLWRWPGSLSTPSAGLQRLTQRAYCHPEYAQLRALQHAAQTHNATRRWLARFFAYAVFLSLILTALSQPYRIGKRLPVPEHHRDIVFIVDTSLNMILRDYVVAGQRIERLRMLKDVLQQFINALHGNRIGLVVFSEQPYYYVPLTSDYALLQYQLQRLEAAVLTGRTSDISRALLYSLQQVAPPTADDTGPRPVLVLITDANRTARHIDPRAAAAYIAQRHMHLHTIAIGAGSYAAEDKDHVSLIYHPASFYLLEQIAKAGQGKFFWARDEASLQQALRVINQSEERDVKAAPQFVRHPLYFWPLGLALLWLTLWQVFTLARGRR